MSLATRLTVPHRVDRRVRYHYFNFTAEPPRIYLGARLMSLEIVADSAKIRDRNARARSRLCTHELLVNGTCVDRSASLQTRDDRTRFEIGRFRIEYLSDSTCDLSNLHTECPLVCRPFIPRILWSIFCWQKFHYKSILLFDYDSKGAI